MAKRFRKLRHTLGYYIIRLGVFSIHFLPVALGRTLFGFIGEMAITFGGRDLSYARANIQKQYPEKTKREVRLFLRKMYHTLGVSFFDGIKLPSLPKKQFFKYLQFQNLDILDKAYSNDKGVVILTGHMSAFEIQPPAFSLAGYSVFTVGAPLFDKRVDTLIASLRERHGVTYFQRGNAARKIIRLLRKRYGFGALIDQDATNDGVFVPFLGELAFTPSAPLQMALKYDIPVVISLLHRDSNGQYILTLQGPIIPPNSGDLKKDLLDLARIFNDQYSEHILQYPEQWVWMHRRWKRKPEDFPHLPSVTDYLPKES